MKYGDKICMLKDYDRLTEGRELVAGRDVTVGVARVLCRGDEPYAEPVRPPQPEPVSDDGDEE